MGNTPTITLTTTPTLPEVATTGAVLGIVGGSGRAQGAFGSVKSAREKALEEMLKEAAKLGANAIVGVSFAMSEDNSGQTVMVTGTAIKRG